MTDNKEGKDVICKARGKPKNKNTPAHNFFVERFHFGIGIPFSNRKNK
jgi:hypothetical protein